MLWTILVCLFALGWCACLDLDGPFGDLMGLSLPARKFIYLSKRLQGVFSRFIEEFMERACCGMCFLHLRLDAAGNNAVH